jgi:hypothetical protein
MNDKIIIECKIRYYENIKEFWHNNYLHYCHLIFQKFHLRNKLFLFLQINLKDLITL